jgi:hypothetical protein
MSVSVVLPYMFLSLILTIFRGIVPGAMQLSTLLSSSQLYLGMWLYFLKYRVTRWRFEQQQHDAKVQSIIYSTTFRTIQYNLRGIRCRRTYKCMTAWIGVAECVYWMLLNILLIVLLHHVVVWNSYGLCDT